MLLPILNIRDVAEHQLCCGCGVCAALAPGEIRMADDASNGRRPVIDATQLGDQRNSRAMRACPGITLGHDRDDWPAGFDRPAADDWGPILAVWEGHAADPEIRFAGSSGGAASALALHCIESEGMSGVLHIAARSDRPYLNETVWSTSRADLLARTGSRYAPASPCDGLHLLREAPAPGVFIGKPCDVGGLMRAAKLDPTIGSKVGLAIAFFCAGTPTLNATFALLRRLGVPDPSRLVSLRYRGNGWPGRAVAVWRDDDGSLREASATYAESWGEVLAQDRQFRCNLCLDHTGEFADVAVGDPWHDPPRDEREAGRSIIIARTERGLRLVERAIARGALVAERVPAGRIADAQPNLLHTRAAVVGRIAALRVTLVPVPRFVGMPGWSLWWRHLSMKEKFRSIVGTLARIRRRGLWRRRPVQPLTEGDQPGGTP